MTIHEIITRAEKLGRSTYWTEDDISDARTLAPELARELKAAIDALCHIALHNFCLGHGCHHCKEGEHPASAEATIAERTLAKMGIPSPRALARIELI